MLNANKVTLGYKDLKKLSYVRKYENIHQTN